MWVSRKEFDALKEEVKRIKERSEHSALPHYQTIYKEVDGWRFYTCWQSVPRMDISVNTVIGMILTKLGMHLEYIEGQSAHVQLVKKTKP